MKKRLYRVIPLLLFSMGMVVLAQTVTLKAQIGVGDGISNVQSEAFELEVIRLTNLERTSRGLHPLQRNGDLTDAARTHNLDMIVNNFFDHTGSDGSSPSVRACREGFTPYGWGACYVGENIAGGYSTPASVVAGWMDSSGHKANILNTNYREIGVGHNTGGYWGHYWTMALGAQPFVLPVFINDDTDESTTRSVQLTLTKEDVSSNGSIGAITGVKLSEDPSFSGVSWRSWAKYVPFTLSIGNGVKTVYVKFTDGSHEVVSSDTILLNEPVPVLAVSPQGMTFLAELGSGETVPFTHTLSISNVGGDLLNWTAVSDVGWLFLGDTAGTAPADMAVWVENSGGVLNSLGTKSASITVTATNPDAQNTPQIVPISLLVVNTVQEIYLPVINNP